MSIKKRNCEFKIIVIFSLLISTAYAVTGFPIQCPATLKISQSIAHNYLGWRSLIIQPHYYLNNITFYSGKPEELVSLIPDSSTQKTAIWKFSSNDQVYLSCSYNQTSIQLTQPLPKFITQCQVWYNPNIHSSSGYSIPTRIICIR